MRDVCRGIHFRASKPVRSKTRRGELGQKRSPGRPRVRRIIESVRWGAVTDPGTHPFSHKEKTNSIIISRAATKFALTISKKVSPREAEPFTRLMLDSPDHDSRFSFLPRLPAYRSP